MPEAYHWYLASMSGLAAVVALVAAQASYEPHGARVEVTLANHQSFIITTDKTGSPKTVAAILKLVKSSFYDGQRFHRVEPWLVQWGDPQSRNLEMGDSRMGQSGSGHALPFESSSVEFLRGVVGVASTATGVGGDCQLFILTKDTTHLNGGYAVFGKVTSGMKVVDSIKLGDRIESVQILAK